MTTLFYRTFINPAIFLGPLDPEDEGTTNLPNVDNYIPVETAKHPRKKRIFEIFIS